MNRLLLFFAVLYLFGYSRLSYHVFTQFSLGLFVTWLIITGTVLIIIKLMWNSIKDIFK